MTSFFEWFYNLSDRRPWLILGKGPTFLKHEEISTLDRDYITMGLNHVCRERKVAVTHVIDVNVLIEVPSILERTEYLVMPMHPHVNFRATETTLKDMVKTHPIVRAFDTRDALLWYNASTWKGEITPGAPVVHVVYFSAEAAVRLLAMAGVRQIRTLGVDGGARYSEAFSDIKPFRGGHSTFDHQQGPIDETICEFGLDFGPLNT